MWNKRRKKIERGGKQKGRNKETKKEGKKERDLISLEYSLQDLTVHLLVDKQNLGFQHRRQSIYLQD